MLSKNQVKSIVALQQKKFRRESGLFIAEGEKVVLDLLKSHFQIKQIFCLEGFMNELELFIADREQTEVFIVTESELKKISNMESPQSVVAVAAIPDDHNAFQLKKSLTLVLDDIQDPGNMGTLLRIADWFGIDTIICSKETVDCYNPKVVQASMGSLFRVNVTYMDLPELFDLNLQKVRLPVYGTLLQGENIFNAELSPEGLIVLGNESAGIKSDNQKFITKQLSIPSFHKRSSDGPDSLNVSVAAGIVCAEFRRRNS